MTGSPSPFALGEFLQHPLVRGERLPLTENEIARLRTVAEYAAASRA